MVFWGAPVEDPRHARNGVLAGMALQKECEVLNAKFAARGWPALRIGVGLNSGNVRVGDMGSQVRRAYAVLNLQRLYPGRELYARCADRVAGFRRTPPPAGWDGVTTFDEK